MTFKKWLQIMEGGPGGNATWDNPNRDMVARAKSDAKKGVGAHLTLNRSDNPPDNGPTSPDADYYPLTSKKMKKRMKKS